MFHDVELVVDQAALGSPLLQAHPIGFVHIHTGRLNGTALKSTQLGLEKLVQSCFLPLPPEPQWLPRLQITHHREELLFLPQIDLVYPHLPQRRLPSCCRPALRIPHIDGSHRAAGQAKLSAYAPHGCTLTCANPTASSKRLLNGALLGNCGTFSLFNPQSGHRTRYNSITTVARYSDQGRSRTSR